jgi:hypothetical protein
MSTPETDEGIRDEIHSIQGRLWKLEQEMSIIPFDIERKGNVLSKKISDVEQETVRNRQIMQNYAISLSIFLAVYYVLTILFF